MDEEILNSLLKRAKGYNYSEVQEEYSVVDGAEPVLVKRKVLEKYCPPDSAALKTYLELNPDSSLSEMSDLELEREKQRLLDELKLLENSGADGIEASPSDDRGQSPALAIPGETSSREDAMAVPALSPPAPKGETDGKKR